MTDVAVTTEATETKAVNETCIECGIGIAGNPRAARGWCPPCYAKNYRNKLKDTLKALKEEVDNLRAELTKATIERDFLAGMVKR